MCVRKKKGRMFVWFRHDEAKEGPSAATTQKNKDDDMIQTESLQVRKRLKTFRTKNLCFESVFNLEYVQQQQQQLCLISMRSQTIR